MISASTQERQLLKKVNSILIQAGQYSELSPYFFPTTIVYSSHMKQKVFDKNVAQFCLL
jgi:hypothetical protein